MTMWSTDRQSEYAVATFEVIANGRRSAKAFQDQTGRRYYRSHACTVEFGVEPASRLLRRNVPDFEGSRASSDISPRRQKEALCNFNSIQGFRSGIRNAM
jgi:hypothetical protein